MPSTLTLLLIKISPFAIVLLIFFILKLILFPTRNFREFYLGESGSYSLSKVQNVAWVYLIISVQVGVLIALGYKQWDYIYDYTVLIPEELLFLLGLSSASYLAVKQITITQTVNRGKSLVKTRDFSDLVSGENGMDFTKFQFLVWTIIAVYVYLLHCNEYINLIVAAKDRTDVRQCLNESFTGLPTVSWSFIILMGLSQGAYVGKKLIPEFKVDQFKGDRILDINKQIENLSAQILSKSRIIQLATPGTAVGKMQLKVLEKELGDLEKQKELLVEELNRTIS